MGVGVGVGVEVGVGVGAGVGVGTGLKVGVGAEEVSTKMNQTILRAAWGSKSKSRNIISWSGSRWGSRSWGISWSSSGSWGWSRSWSWRGCLK